MVSGEPRVGEGDQALKMSLKGQVKEIADIMLGKEGQGTLKAHLVRMVVGILAIYCP